MPHASPPSPSQIMTLAEYFAHRVKLNGRTVGPLAPLFDAHRRQMGVQDRLWKRETLLSPEAARQSQINLRALDLSGSSDFARELVDCLLLLYDEQQNMAARSYFGHRGAMAFTHLEKQAALGRDVHIKIRALKNELARLKEKYADKNDRLEGLLEIVYDDLDQAKSRYKTLLRDASGPNALVREIEMNPTLLGTLKGGFIGSLLGIFKDNGYRKAVAAVPRLCVAIVESNAAGKDVRQTRETYNREIADRDQNPSMRSVLEAFSLSVQLQKAVQSVDPITPKILKTQAQELALAAEEEEIAAATIEDGYKAFLLGQCRRKREIAALLQNAWNSQSARFAKAAKVRKENQEAARQLESLNEHTGAAYADLWASVAQTVMSEAATIIMQSDEQKQEARQYNVLEMVMEAVRRAPPNVA